MAAYGGIMGADGRRQYGIGSFFQKYITAGTMSDGVDIGISYLNILKEVTT